MQANMQSSFGKHKSSAGGTSSHAREVGLNTEQPALKLRHSEHTKSLRHFSPYIKVQRCNTCNDPNCDIDHRAGSKSAKYGNLLGPEFSSTRPSSSPSWKENSKDCQPSSSKLRFGQCSASSNTKHRVISTNMKYVRGSSWGEVKKQSYSASHKTSFRPRSVPPPEASSGLLSTSLRPKLCTQNTVQLYKQDSTFKNHLKKFTKKQSTKTAQSIKIAELCQCVKKVCLV